MDSAATYDEARERISALVVATGDGGRGSVPACPEWTVKDVVAHVTGIAADWRNFNLGDYGTESWTDAQVMSRRGLDLASILGEWAEHTDAITPMLTDPVAAGLPSFMPMVVITDLAAHEHDIRGALGRPGARDSEAVTVGLQAQVGGLRRNFGAVGLPTLCLEASGLRDWMIGLGDPVATLRGEPFELFRATGGRRTVDEVRAMHWEGDAEVFIPHLLQPPYRWPEAPLRE